MLKPASKVVVLFTRPSGCYQSGDVAGFESDYAERLVAAGCASYYVAKAVRAEASEPPVVSEPTRVISKKTVGRKKTTRKG